MPTARCSPIIVAEMAEWTALGGANFGCLGAYDGSHETGFHRAGFEIPPTDYSRRHDPGLPYDMEWACAGDFAHNGWADLRARHAAVLGGLMRGLYPMIDEFIGQPIASEPVKYWARWLGVSTLRNYTGAGHTTWSHISWRRSRANERAYLWRETDMSTELATHNAYLFSRGAVMLDKDIWVFPEGQISAPPGSVLRPNPLAAAVIDLQEKVTELVERPAGAVTLSAEDRATIVAELKAELGELLGRTRLSVDPSAPTDTSWITYSAGG